MNNCPTQLQSALLDIIYQTLLEIRANSRDSAYCFALAEHAHNIPSLIEEFSAEKFFYYWECEQRCFVADFQKLRPSVTLFQSEWRVIADIHEKVRSTTHSAPAIIMEIDSGLIDVARNEAEMATALDPTRAIMRFRILDYNGIERRLTRKEDGSYACMTSRADIEEIRRYLIAVGKSHTVFDEFPLVAASSCSEMFASYLGQTS